MTDTHISCHVLKLLVLIITRATVEKEVIHRLEETSTAFISTLQKRPPAS